MSGSWAAALIPILLLLPGYSLLHAGCPRRLRLPFVVFASVIVTSVVGLTLVVMGRFSVPLIAALEAPLILIRIRSRYWPAVGLRSVCRVSSRAICLRVLAMAATLSSCRVTF